MKKPAVCVLVLITCIFASFLAGFSAGRNLDRTPVRIWQAAPPAEQTILPTAEDPAETGPAETVIIDINTATAAQLETLPGIGPVLAARIIRYREENGPFRDIGELTKVSGIGAGKLEEIMDLITVGGNA